MCEIPYVIECIKSKKESRQASIDAIGTAGIDDNEKLEIDGKPYTLDEISRMSETEKKNLAYSYVISSLHASRLVIPKSLQKKVVLKTPKYRTQNAL